MGVFKKPAMFVPEEHLAEVFANSKAALADVAWNLAAQLSANADDPASVWSVLAAEIETTQTYRKSE